MSNQREAEVMASQPESGSPDWFFAATLTMCFEEGEETFVSSAPPG